MGKGWGKGNSGDDDNWRKCGSLVIINLIIQSLFSGFIVGCIFASYAPWVEYDTAACDDHKWREGRCTVLSGVIKTFKSDSNDKDDWHYYVNHQVALTTADEDGNEVILARAWKAPSWAMGTSKLESGDKWNARRFSEKSQAKHYNGRFKPGEEYGCYYDPETIHKDKPKRDVSFQCRDYAIRERYKGGVATVCVFASPFFFLMVIYCCGFVRGCFAEHRSGFLSSSTEMPTRRRSFAGARNNNPSVPSHPDASTVSVEENFSPMSSTVEDGDPPLAAATVLQVDDSTVTMGVTVVDDTSATADVVEASVIFVEDGTRC